MTVRGEQAEVLRAALDGDQSAWNRLVSEHRSLVWAVVIGMGLRGDDAEDAFQLTFIRLLEKGRNVRQPDHLAGWLATTARNEARGIHRRRRRVVTVDEVRDPAAVDTDDLAAGMVMDDRRIGLRRAMSELSAACQELLRLLFTEPPLTYEDISELLGIPIGSIGPTRARCLDRLRRSVHLRGV